MNKPDISFIYPPETTLDIEGVTYTVRPITMRVLPALVRCVEPVLADMSALVLRPSIEGAVAMLGRHGETVCEAIAICLGKDLAAIQDLLPDRVAALLLTCCEVNADFFDRAATSFTGQAGLVAPLLLAKVNALLETQRIREEAAAPSAGPTPSSSSQAPAIATTTS